MLVPDVSGLAEPDSVQSSKIKSHVISVYSSAEKSEDSSRFSRSVTGISMLLACKAQFKVFKLGEKCVLQLQWMDELATETKTTFCTRLQESQVAVTAGLGWFGATFIPTKVSWKASKKVLNSGRMHTRVCLQLPTSCWLNKFAN